MLSLRGILDKHVMINNSARQIVTENEPWQQLNGRVLLIAPQPFFQNRGTPLNVRRMVEDLASFGLEVDLLVYAPGERISISGVTISRVVHIPGMTDIPIGPSFKKVILDVFLFWQALWLMISNRYAVVHGVEEGAFIAGVLSFFSKAKFVFDMDSCMSDQIAKSGIAGSSFVPKLFAVLEEFFIKRATAVLTVCTALSNYAKQVSSTVPIHQIEDCPVDEGPPDEELVAKLREEFSLSNKKIILYTGNFEAYQGVGLLLESFAKLELSENVILLLVGGGALEGDQVKKYKKEALNLGVSEQVIFTGNRPLIEMSAFTALATVLVSPRLKGENTPLKLYSYMASGKPIVASDIASHTQVVNQDSSFLAAPEPEAFADGLSQALDSSDVALIKKEQLVANAKKLVDERYSAACFKKRLHALYKEVLSS